MASTATPEALSNSSIRPRKVWLTRHGESVFNQQALIGGDSPLSCNGQQYAAKLPSILEPRLLTAAGGVNGADTVVVWTSTLQRTIQTAAHLSYTQQNRPELDEINAGICDSMSYEQIAEQYPAVFEARKKDKLAYRYPEGESYLDLLQRLQPVFDDIQELGMPVVIISHQAVLRAVLGHLTSRPLQDIPRLSVPLHTVLELTFLRDGTVDVELIPVAVSLSDGHSTQHDPPTAAETSVPTNAANGAAAGAVSASTGGGNGGVSCFQAASHDVAPPAAGGGGDGERECDGSTTNDVDELADQLRELPLKRKLSLHTVCSCSSSSTIAHYGKGQTAAAAASILKVVPSQATAAPIAASASS